MAGGFLSEKWLGRPHPEIDHLENHSLVKYLLVIDDTLSSEGYQELLGRLAAMKAGTGLSIAALATLYVLGLTHVAAAIVGTRSSRHIADTMSLIGRELPPKLRRELDAFVGGFAQIEGDCFDAERELGGQAPQHHGREPDGFDDRQIACAQEPAEPFLDALPALKDGDSPLDQRSAFPAGLQGLLPLRYRRAVPKAHKWSSSAPAPTRNPQWAPA